MDSIDRREYRGTHWKIPVAVDHRFSLSAREFRMKGFIFGGCSGLEGAPMMHSSYATAFLSKS